VRLQALMPLVLMAVGHEHSSLRVFVVQSFCESTLYPPTGHLPTGGQYFSQGLRWHRTTYRIGQCDHLAFARFAHQQYAAGSEGQHARAVKLAKTAMWKPSGTFSCFRSKGLWSA